MQFLVMVDQDRLQLTVSRQVSPEQKGEIVLISLKSGGTLLLQSSLVMYVRSGIFFSTVGPFHPC